jgi:hypothetical protein
MMGKEVDVAALHLRLTAGGEVRKGPYVGSTTVEVGPAREVVPMAGRRTTS